MARPSPPRICAPPTNRRSFFDADFGLGKLSSPRRLYLFRNAFVQLLRTFANSLDIEDEFIPPRAAALVNGRRCSRNSGEESGLGCPRRSLHQNGFRRKNGTSGGKGIKPSIHIFRAIANQGANFFEYGTALLKPPSPHRSQTDTQSFCYLLFS